MADMLHEISINAPPEPVYEAIATQEGLRGWWTLDSVAADQPGDVAEFGFDDGAMLLRMRIDELVPGKRAKWTCLGDASEWRGTELLWDIQASEGGSVLRLRHANWRRTSGWFAVCNTTWGALLYRLRDYVEGRAPGPLFTGRG